jgi:hypothetical protein
VTSPAARAIEAAQRASAAIAGGAIVYTRGDNSVTLDATFGRTDFQAVEDGVIQIEHSDRDFIVPSASLILDEVLATPQKGDTIAVDNETFEVLAPKGAQVYRPCDPQGTLIRIHAKRVA